MGFDIRDMTDAAEVVSFIFVLAVGGVLLLIVRQSVTGGNIQEITELVTNYAQPFIVLLVVLFFLLSFGTEF